MPKFSNKKVFPSDNCEIFNFCQQWPPPEVLYALKPAREECQAQTGVSDGKKNGTYLFSFPLANEHLAHQNMVQMNFRGNQRIQRWRSARRREAEVLHVVFVPLFVSQSF